ncbi:MAG TPA: hypothetical protein VFA16_06980 [Mycobacterium sp.]|uniref:hypothetical protein n=1 Tax=Mycobacterium sp. TaxID=1785 RepID=UPI002D535BD0|nr:hypothetical protein [Mycobacterium sp.]HZU46980.1 hypothetical protein [Mycobacterium sp.]
MRDRNLSDETPIADAVEQEQETAPEPASVEHADVPVEVPMEANAPDWQDQLHEVVEDDRDEYRG